MEIISLIVSVAALLGSAVTYFMHERRLKAQEAKINAYQLRKFEEEERESKEAKVRAGIIKQGAGKRTIKIYNKGKAQARDIRFQVQESGEGDVLHILDSPFPLSLLNEGDYVDVLVFLTEETPERAIVCLEWDDDSGPGKRYQQILQF